MIINYLNYERYKGKLPPKVKHIGSVKGFFNKKGNRIKYTEKFYIHA